MKEPKFGRWVSVLERMPGRDEAVLAVNPQTAAHVIATGGELATSPEYTYWMPLLKEFPVEMKSQ